MRWRRFFDAAVLGVVGLADRSFSVRGDDELLGAVPGVPSRGGSMCGLLLAVLAGERLGLALIQWSDLKKTLR